MPDAVVTRLCRRLAVKSVCTKYKVRSIFPQVWPSIRKEVRPVPAQCPSLVSGSLGRRNKKEKKGDESMDARLSYNSEARPT